MHVHQSISKDGKPLFAGDKYGGLSRARALLHRRHHQAREGASTRSRTPTTNSYKRLVPGFEAPVMLAYSARNRSASIRIPWVANPKGRRIEVRFPDSTANPYLGFAAMLMAGLDGIQNKIHPGEPRTRICTTCRRKKRSTFRKSATRWSRRSRRSMRSRLPEGGRRVHRRRDRCVHRTEDAGSDQGAHVDASARVRVVLQRVMHGRAGSSGRSPSRGGLGDGVHTPSPFLSSVCQPIGEAAMLWPHAYGAPATARALRLRCCPAPPATTSGSGWTRRASRITPISPCPARPRSKCAPAMSSQPSRRLTRGLGVQRCTAACRPDLSQFRDLATGAGPVDHQHRWRGQRRDPHRAGVQPAHS